MSVRKSPQDVSSRPRTFENGFARITSCSSRARSPVRDVNGEYPTWRDPRTFAQDRRPVDGPREVVGEVRGLGTSEKGSRMIGFRTLTPIVRFGGRGPPRGSAGLIRQARSGITRRCSAATRRDHRGAARRRARRDRRGFGHFARQGGLKDKRSCGAPRQARRVLRSYTDPVVKYTQRSRRSEGAGGGRVVGTSPGSALGDLRRDGQITPNPASWAAFGGLWTADRVDGRCRRDGRTGIVGPTRAASHGAIAAADQYGNRRQAVDAEIVRADRAARRLTSSCFAKAGGERENSRKMC